MAKRALMPAALRRPTGHAGSRRATGPVPGGSPSAAGRRPGRTPAGPRCDRSRRRRSVARVGLPARRGAELLGRGHLDRRRGRTSLVGRLGCRSRLVRRGRLGPSHGCAGAAVAGGPGSVRSRGRLGLGRYDVDRLGRARVRGRPGPAAFGSPAGAARLDVGARPGGLAAAPASLGSGLRGHPAAEPPRLARSGSAAAVASGGSGRPTGGVLGRLRRGILSRAGGVGSARRTRRLGLDCGLGPGDLTGRVRPSGSKRDLGRGRAASVRSSGRPLPVGGPGERVEVGRRARSRRHRREGSRRGARVDRAPGSAGAGSVGRARIVSSVQP